MIEDYTKRIIRTDSVTSYEVTYDFDMENFHIYSIVDICGEEVKRGTSVWFLIMDILAEEHANIERLAMEDC